MIEENGEKTQPRLTLGKAEKLRHKSLVDGLFAEGASTSAYPLRMVWRVLDCAGLEGSFRLSVPEGIGRLQMLVSIPKRKRRHAVDRVLLRRRVREAYRLNRAPLRQWLDAHPQCRSIEMAFIYMADYNADYATVERKMQKLLQRLLDALDRLETPTAP